MRANERVGNWILRYFAVGILMVIFSSINAQYIQKKIEKLPEFSYQTLEGKSFTHQHLKEDARLMIVYFNPLCDVCQKETQEILTNIDYFKDIQIIMVSPNPVEEILVFTKENKFEEHTQIIVLHDSKDEFFKEFKAIGYPALYLYDKDKNLIERFDSHTAFEEIKEAFEPGISKK